MKKFFCAIASLCLLPSLIYAEPGSDKNLRFRVQVSDLATPITAGDKTFTALNRYLTEGLAKGKEASDYIEVTYPGMLYNPSRKLMPVGQKAAKYDTPLDAAQADFSAQKAENDRWILNTFAANDQPEIQKYLNDKAMRETNFKMARVADAREVSGEIRYQGYAILFVKDTPSLPGMEKRGAMPFTYKETPQGWKRTNDLSSDIILDILIPMLRDRKGEITEETPQ